MLRKSPRLVAVAALALVALGFTASFNAARAQDRGQPTMAIFSGRENLQGFGPLTFGLNSSGVAVMIDASCDVNDPNTWVKGQWSRQGQVITIRFGGCVYQGRLNGQVLAGTGRNANGVTWDFSVRFIPPQPQNNDVMNDRG